MQTVTLAGYLPGIGKFCAVFAVEKRSNFSFTGHTIAVFTALCYSQTIAITELDSGQIRNYGFTTSNYEKNI